MNVEGLCSVKVDGDCSRNIREGGGAGAMSARTLTLKCRCNRDPAEKQKYQQTRTLRCAEDQQLTSAIYLH